MLEITYAPSAQRHLFLQNPYKAKELRLESGRRHTGEKLSGTSNLRGVSR